MSSCTCESSNGPGINHNVAQLEAELVNGKLYHHVHGVGLILGERNSLPGRKFPYINKTILITQTSSSLNIKSRWIIHNPSSDFNLPWESLCCLCNAGELKPDFPHAVIFCCAARLDQMTHGEHQTRAHWSVTMAENRAYRAACKSRVVPAQNGVTTWNRFHC